MVDLNLTDRVLITDQFLACLPKADEEKVAVLVASEFEGIFKNGGIGTYYRTLSQKLASSGWKIILVLFKEEKVFRGQSALAYIDTTVSANYISQALILSDCHQLMLSQFDEWDWKGRESYSILFLIQALTHYFQSETQVYIEFQDFWGIGYPTVQAKEAGLFGNNYVIATTIHGPHDWIYEVNNRFAIDDVNSWKWSIDASFQERVSFEKADLPIYLSRFLGRKMKGYGWCMDQAIHLPYCFPILTKNYSEDVNPRLVDLNQKIGAKIPIIFFGRLEERKGFFVFVDAIKSLPKKILDQIYILFMGRVVPLSQHDVKHYDSQSYLDKHCYGLVSYEIFPDLFSQEALNIIQHLRNPIVCLASLEENFPNTGLEIGQLPVSLVVSNTGGFQETIDLVKRQDAVRWFKPGNVQSLSATLKDAITHYPENPTVCDAEVLEQVNAALLAQRFEKMATAFEQTQFKVADRTNVLSSITVHCHIANVVEGINFFLETLHLSSRGQCQVILTYSANDDYYHYLARNYPAFTFTKVSPDRSLGEILNQVARSSGTDYFLSIPSPNYFLVESIFKGIRQTVARSQAELITLPVLVQTGKTATVEYTSASLSKIITADSLSEVVLACSTVLLEEFKYPEDLDLQAHNLHLLCFAVATGKNIVQYPYPLIKAKHNLKLQIEPIVFLKQLNYIHRTLASIGTNKWQKRQLYRVLLACEKLAHMSIHRERVETAKQVEQDDNYFLTHAKTKYSQILNIEPNNTGVRQKLGRIYVKQGDMARGFELYGLERVDQKAIQLDPQEVLCFLVVRNELLRLPYLLDFYRLKGVKKFFIAENDSNDGTREFLAEQADVYLWTTTRSYKEAHMGIDWNEILLRRYGQGHWCLNIDADEILYYPGFEAISIPELCDCLEQQNKYAFSTILLDMYSDRPICESFYRSGEDFLQVCPYFDRQFYHYKEERSGPCKNMTYFRGGLRQRVFNHDSKDVVFTINKVPLIKYDDSVVIYAGHHWTNLPEKLIAQSRGALLHFKYLSSFVDYIDQEVGRNEHVGGAFEYRKYQAKLKENEALTLYHPKHSLKLESSQTLLDSGVMVLGELPAELTGKALKRYAKL